MNTNAIHVLVFPDSHEAEAHGFNYNEWEKRPLATEAVKAVIVQKGTVGGRPTVDFLAQDKDGNQYVFMITGRLLETIVSVANTAGRAS